MAESLRQLDGKLSVFISYSRDDLDFADQLEATLSLAGFATTLDRRGIHGGEEWKEKLATLIRDAEAIVFVLSPASSRSKVCAWEVQEAIRLGKRIIPVVCQAIEDANPPEQLRVLDYIYFYRNPKKPDSGFRTGIHELINALNDIPDWLREHTRLLRLASDWEAAGRVTNRLLSGSDIAKAKDWIAERPTELPPPSDLQLDFIRASDEAETNRRSAEHQRLKEMETLQNAREVAIKDKEAAQQERDTETRAKVLRTYAWLATTVVAALAVVGVVFHLKELNRQELQKQNKANLESQRVTTRSLEATRDQNASIGLLLALEALPDRASDHPDEKSRPEWPPAGAALQAARRELRELAVLAGHTAGINAVAMTRDGTRIVTGSEDGTARVWNAETRVELVQLRGHAGSIRGLAITPDSSRIVTAATDRTARIWDASSGVEISQIKGHTDEVLAVAVTRDGNRIITGSSDNTARVWDAKSGDELLQLKGHSSLIYSVAVTDDGARIFTGSWDRTVRIWDAKTGAEISRLGHEADVNGVAVSGDGTRVITSTDDPTVRIWDAKTGKEQLQLKGHDGPVYAVAYSPDETRIVSASRDGSVRIWDARTGEELAELRGHSDSVMSVAVTPDGKRIVTASSDSTARVWDAKTDAEQRIFTGHSGQLYGVAVTPDGAQIITVAWGGTAPPTSTAPDPTARVWNASSGAEQRIFKGHAQDINAVAVMPDSERIVTASDDRTVRIWSAKTGAELLQLEGHAGYVLSVAVSRDGKRIVSGSGDNTARIWDSETGKLIAPPLKGHADSVLGVAMTPDGSYVVTASADNTARVWQFKSAEGADTGEWLTRAELKGHNGAVTSVAVTTDGKKIVTGSSDGTAQVWDLATAKPIVKPLKGHTAEVLSVAVTGDGTRVVTGSEDKTARVWAVATGNELAELKGHTGPVQSVAVTPDDQHVVTASHDKTARVWALLPVGQDLVSDAKTEVPRCLTPVERAEHHLVETPPRWCTTRNKWPYDAVGGLVEGSRLLQQGRDDKAEILFKVLLGRPDSDHVTHARIKEMRVSAHIRRGEAFLSRGNKDEDARAQFNLAYNLDEKAINQIDTAWARAYFRRGETLLRQRKDNEAEAQFRLALEKDPTTSARIDAVFAQAYFSRGEALLREGKDEEAEAQFKLALSRNPDATERINAAWADAYIDRGEGLLRDAKDEEAEAQFKLALARKPDAKERIYAARAETYLDRGKTLLSSGQDDDANAQFDLAMRLDPNATARIQLIRADVYFERGQEYLVEKKDDEAKAQFALARKLDPTDRMRADIHNTIAWQWLMRGTPGNGLADADEAVKLMPEDGSILDTRGRIYLALGQTDKAYNDLNKAITNGFEDPGTFFSRGVCRQERGEIEAAKEDYRKARALSANDDDARDAQKKAAERLRALGERVPDETPRPR